VKEKRIVFYDGHCILCNKSVQFLLTQDIHQKLSFATLQSAFAKDMLLHGEFKFDRLPESVIFFDGTKMFTNSDAVFEALRQANGKKSWLGYFRIVPKFIRDFIYEVVAKNRYKWFGKAESCIVPPEKWKERFLS
jgi:predicted DCC family thiol-disulfide oxidoreductase YuxK